MDSLYFIISYIELATGTHFDTLRSIVDTESDKKTSKKRAQRRVIFTRNALMLKHRILLTYHDHLSNPVQLRTHTQRLHRQVLLLT